MDVESDQSWLHDVACRGFSWHFDDDDGDAVTRRLCGGCPVADPCLEYLLGLEAQAGFGAGMTADQRERLKRRRERDDDQDSEESAA